MIARIVLGEYKEEQALPLVVVAGGVIQLELDVAGDVDAVRGGRGGKQLDRGVGRVSAGGRE
jgi:hypothetical protein